jgi:hypothetical protein
MPVPTWEVRIGNFKVLALMLDFDLWMANLGI